MADLARHRSLGAGILVLVVAMAVLGSWEGSPGVAWAEGELFVANIGSNSVTVYDRTASGNTPPLRTLAGAATGLSQPVCLVVDTVNNELLVLNAGSSSLTVYSLTAAGDTAPLRTLLGAATGLSTPAGLAVDTVNNEVFISNAGGNKALMVYPRTGSGNTAPLRTLSGPATGLTGGASRVVVNTVNNELLVSNQSDSSVLVYTRTASGNTAPLRTLSGPATGLNVPIMVALDLTHNELLVGNFGGNNPSVTVYTRTASGNTAPLRTLSGAATGLNDPAGLAVDLANDELMVANELAPSVTVYPRTASGNRAPLRTLSGPATGLSLPAFVAVVASAGPPPPPTTLVASVLPSSRSVQVGIPATAFVTIINAGPNTAFAVGIALASPIPATFTFNQTSCATNAVIGGGNVPVDIAAGGSACYVISIIPTAAFAPIEVVLSFAGTNTPPVTTLVGINTLLMSASVTAPPDIVALAATATGDGILHIPGPAGSGAFVVATSNVGASGLITASANTGAAFLSLALSICQTDPATGVCISAIGPSVTVQINAGATPTFAIFATASGTIVLDAATNRIFVVFAEAGNVVRGRTSVAVTTQ